MAARHTSALRLLVALALCFYCYGRELRDGVFTVKFINGTQRSLKYQVPKTLQHTAPGAQGAVLGVDAGCCMPLEGDVAANDSFHYSLYSTTNCQPFSRVCDLPGKVQAVWVCGCPGGDCSGEHIVSAQTTMLDADAAAAAGQVSAVTTEQLYVDHGLPTRISAFVQLVTNSTDQHTTATGNSSTGGCALQGFKVEYNKKSDVIGQPTTNKVVLGTGLKKDPIVEVVFQKQGSCLTYLKTKTRSGRSTSVGTLQPLSDLHTATTPEGADGLAALEGTVVQPQSGAAATKKAPRGAMSDVHLLWGVSKCSAHGSGRRKAAAAAAAMDGAAAAGPVGGAESRAAPAGATAAGPSGGAEDKSDPGAVTIPVGALASQLVAAASKRLKGPGAPVVAQPRRWRAAASAAVAGRFSWMKSALNKATPRDEPESTDVEEEEEEEQAQVTVASAPQVAAANKAPKWVPALLQMSRPIGFTARPTATAMTAQAAGSVQHATSEEVTAEAEEDKEPQEADAEEEEEEEEWLEAQPQKGPLSQVRRRARAAVVAVAKPFKRGGGLRPAMFMLTGGSGSNKPAAQPASAKAPAANPDAVAAPTKPDAAAAARLAAAAAVAAAARRSKARAASQQAADAVYDPMAAEAATSEEVAKAAATPTAAAATATATAAAIKVQDPAAHSRLAAPSSSSSNSNSSTADTPKKAAGSSNETLTAGMSTSSSVSRQASTTNSPAVISSSSPSKAPVLAAVTSTHTTNSSAKVTGKDSSDLTDHSKDKNNAQQGAAQTTSSSSSSSSSSSVTKASSVPGSTPSPSLKASTEQTIKPRVRRFNLRRQHNTSQKQQQTTTTSSTSAPAPSPAAAPAVTAAAAPAISTAAAAVLSPAPPPKSQRFNPCRLSDPFCFKDDECYCKLANGTFGAACPMYGSCLGACCSTTGVCPDRMGYEDPQTGAQSVLLPSTCGDWGLDAEGPVLPAGWTNALECKLPKSGKCVPGKAGSACMGYSSCKGGDCSSIQGQDKLVGAMCVYAVGDSSRFDVCSCLPIY